MPASGLRNPAMLLSSVVLPAPLRPTQATTCLGRTLRSMSNKTFDSPYETFRPLTVSIGSSFVMNRQARPRRSGLSRR